MGSVIEHTPWSTRLRKARTAEERAQSLQTLGIWAARLAVVLGADVLVLGWIIGFDGIVRLSPTYAGMAPSTAAMFILGGLAAELSIRTKPAAVGRGRLVGLAAWVIIAVSGLNLAIAGASSLTGIDELCFGSLSPDGRVAMSPATSCNFIAIALGLLLPRLRSGHRAQLIAVGLATFGLLTSLVALTGYAFDAESLYSVWLFTSIAMHTSLGFVLLGGSVLLGRPWVGWVGVLIGDEIGSRGVRRLLPISIFCPLALSWLAHIATQYGLFDAEFRLSVIAIVCVGTYTATLIRSGMTQNRAERTRQRTLDELAETAAHRNLLLQEVHHRVRNNLQQISALLHIESHNAKGEDARRALQDTEIRIQAMGLVHGMLVQSAGRTGVLANAFLGQLCKQLGEALGAAERGVEIRCDAQAVELDAELTNAVGLIVHECVANSLRHGFPDGRTGTIQVKLSLADDARSGLILNIRDNGVGTTEEFGPSRLGGGTSIVEGLASQIGAGLRSDGGDGYMVEVRVPLNNLKEAGT